MAKTAIVLSGGGSRGAYQAGCWRALDEAGVDPDLVVGTSVGALNGVLVAQRTPWQEIWDLWSGLRQKDLLRPRRDVWRVWRWTGLYDPSPLGRLAETWLDHAALARGRDLLICAVDLESGAHVTFSGEEITPERLVGSAALVPGVPPQRVDGRLLADGGLAQNPPLRPALDAGATRIYALLHDPVESHAERPDGVRDVLWRVSDIYWHHRLQAELELIEARQHLPRSHARRLPRTEVTCLAPSTALGGDMLRFDPDQARRLLEQGYQETQAALR